MRSEYDGQISPWDVGAELAEGYDCLIFLYYLEHIREAQNYDFKKEGKTN